MAVTAGADDAQLTDTLPSQHSAPGQSLLIQTMLYSQGGVRIERGALNTSLAGKKQQLNPTQNVGPLKHRPHFH